MSEDVPRPGTTSDISRRVEGLEIAVSTLSGDMGKLKIDVALVKQEQGHLREQMKSGFDVLNASLAVIGVKVDAQSTAHQLSLARQAVHNEQQISTASES